MPASDQPRRRGKAIALVSVVAIVVIGAWGLYRLSIFGEAPSDLRKEVLAAEKDGLPIDANDFRRATNATDDQNAAPLLISAFAELKQFQQTPEGKAMGKLIGQSEGAARATDEQLEEVRPAIKHLSSLFDLLDQAVRKPRLDFHRKWESGPGLLFSEFADEKACLVKLILKAKLDLKDGNLGSALDSLDVGAKLSSLVGQDSTIIGLLVQASLRNLVCDVIAGVLRKHGDDAQVLARSKTVLNDFGPRPDVRPAIRAEYLMGRIAVKMLANANGAQMLGSDDGNAALKLARFGPVRTVYELRFIQIYHDLYKRLSQHPESFVAMQKAFADVDNQVGQNSHRDWTYGLADVLAPVFVGMASALGESEARKNVLLCAIDLLDAKRKSGSFPAKGLNNAPYWTDPLTEHPMIYHPTKAGFIVYSVGKDGVDDGGKPRPRSYSGGNYDLPFKYPLADEPVEPARRSITSHGRPSVPSR